MIGTVPEGRFEHRIMVPFAMPGEVTVDRILEGSFTIEEVVATVRDGRGQTQDLTLVQRWPVRRPIPRRRSSRSARPSVSTRPSR